MRSMPALDRPLLVDISRGIIRLGGALAAAALYAAAAHAQDVAQTSTSQAQKPAAFAYSDRLSVLGGLTQIAAGGGNVEVTWYTNRLSFDYSHGFDLRFSGSLVGKAERAQNAEVLMPWTTGFGVGYRVTSALDVRIEPKWHRYRVFYENQDFVGTPITSYTTATLGVGAYYRLYPFRRSTGWAKGLVVAPSVRYWPNVASSLPSGGFSYDNVTTGRRETLKAATQGIPGTSGLFANVSVGYTF